MLFKKGQKIDKYEVMFPCKTGSYAETYRVKDSQGTSCFSNLSALQN